MIKLVNQCEPLDSRFVLGFVSLKGAGGGQAFRICGHSTFG